MKNYDEAINCILRESKLGDIVIGSTGYISRILYENQKYHQDKHFFYSQGSMGLAPAIALGIVMSNPNVNVLVLNGDGATLMNFGTAFNILTQKKKHEIGGRIKVVVLKNGTYASVGGHEIGVDFEIPEELDSVYTSIDVSEPTTRKIERVGVLMTDNAQHIREILNAKK